MAVCFWFRVKRDLSSVRYCTVAYTSFTFLSGGGEVNVRIEPRNTPRKIFSSYFKSASGRTNDILDLFPFIHQRDCSRIFKNFAVESESRVSGYLIYRFRVIWRSM